jgi:hypothetical protein
MVVQVIELFVDEGVESVAKETISRVLRREDEVSVMGCLQRVRGEVTRSRQNEEGAVCSFHEEEGTICSVRRKPDTAAVHFSK